MERIERPGPPDFERPRYLLLLRKYIWVISFVMAAITLVLVRPLMRRVPEAPPVMFQLPQFGLTDQHGDAFTRDSLKGEIWVASFVFTSCPSTCPAVTTAMKHLQDRMDSHKLPLRLVSFTVDPETDTPEVLDRYAGTVGADPERWTFVTGDLPEIRSLLEGGFKLGVGDKEEVDSGLYDIAHSTKLALIGPDGGVRGYYGIDEMGLDEVFHRAQHVLRDYRRRD
jgi:protein SCO1/2